MIKVLIEIFSRSFTKDDRSFLQGWCSNPSDQKQSEVLASFQHARELVQSAGNLRWFPEYGCVAVLLNHERGISRDCAYIHILGLDKFVLEIHKSSMFSSFAHDFQSFGIGPGAREQMELVFGEKFTKIFDNASSRTGNLRSASDGKQGHQRTPMYIRALFQQAYQCDCDGKCSCEEVLPKGGMTDCGLHTGGLERDTRYTSFNNSVLVLILIVIMKVHKYFLL